MTSNDWAAKDYKTGAYIQHTIAAPYVKNLAIAKGAKILDIGAGDGRFSIQLAKKAPQGEVLAIDSSEAMLEQCRSNTKILPNISVDKMDAQSINFVGTFDLICSFWCLHWIEDYKSVFEKIFFSLKDGGQLLALFPTGNDSMMQSFLTLKKSGQFPVLNDFKEPFKFEKFRDIDSRLNTIPFSHLEIKREQSAIKLPSFNSFYQFLKGISYFYKGQVPDNQVEGVLRAQTEIFVKECTEKHSNVPYFEYGCFIVQGKK